MPTILNPTGGTVRNDRGGAGYWKAKRGNRLHKGIDLTLPGGVGQLVLAPISGDFVRVAYPYPDDTTYSGVVIEGSYLTVKMFYVRPDLSLVGKYVRQGQVIGNAQNISHKYSDCEPHIHLQVEEIDPLILF